MLVYSCEFFHIPSQSWYVSILTSSIILLISTYFLKSTKQNLTGIFNLVVLDRNVPFGGSWQKCSIGWFFTGMFHLVVINRNVPLGGSWQECSIWWLLTGMFHWVVLDRNVPFGGYWQECSIGWFLTGMFHLVVLDRNIPLGGPPFNLLLLMWIWNQRWLSEPNVFFW